MGAFAAEAARGVNYDDSGDWLHALKAGYYHTAAGMAGLGEMAYTRPEIENVEGSRLQEQFKRHEMERAEAEELGAMSTRGQYLQSTELGQADDFWGQLALKGLGMVTPMAIGVGSALVGGGVAGSAITASLVNMGLNAGDAALAALQGVDASTDEELQRDASVFNQVRAGVPMERVRANLKLQLGEAAAAPTAIVSAITGPLSAETGLGLWLRGFRPRIGTGFLTRKGVGALAGGAVEGIGETLEEGETARGINIAREQFPYAAIPEQDVGAAQREAGTIGALTGGLFGALSTGRPRVDRAILEEEDTGITKVGESELPPDVKAATDATKMERPPVVDLRGAFSQGALTSGERPGVAVGLRPGVRTDVTPDVTLEDAPYVQQREFLAKYGYVPEDLRGLGPDLRDELNYRFNEFYAPVYGRAEEELDPTLAARGGPTVPSTSPVATSVAAPAGIQSVPSVETPAGAVPPIVTSALGPETTEEGSDIEAIPTTRVPSPTEGLEPSDAALVESIMANRAAAREGTATVVQYRDTPLRAAEEQGTDKRSKAVQAKQQEDEDRARNIWTNAQPLSEDIDIARDQLAQRLADAEGIKIPERVRGEATNEMKWLAHVQRTLNALDTNRDAPELRLLIANEEEARNGDWEPMFRENVRQNVADASYSEALGADTGAAAAEETVAAPYRGPASGRGVGSFFRRRSRGRRKVREITEPSPDETAQALASIATAERRSPGKKWMTEGEKKGMRRGQFLEERRKQRAEDKAKLAEEEEKNKETVAAIKREAAETQDAKKLERVAEMEAEEQAQARVEAIKTRKPSALSQIAAKRQAKEAAEAEKPDTSRKGRSRAMEGIIERAQLKKRINALIKAANKGLRETPAEERTAVYRGGLQEAKDRLTQAKRNLESATKDVPAARRAIQHAEEIIEGKISESKAQFKPFGEKPAPRRARPGPPTLTTVEGGRKGRGRRRNRVAATEYHATEEDLSMRDRVKAVSRRRSLKSAEIVPHKRRARAAQRSGASLPPKGRTSEGNPSQPLRARMPNIWRDIDKALSAITIGEFEQVFDAMRRILRDVRAVVDQGDRGELIKRLEQILRVGLQNTTTADIWRTVARVNRVLKTIDPEGNRNLSIGLKEDTRRIWPDLSLAVTIDASTFNDPAVQELLKDIGVEISADENVTSDVTIEPERTLSGVDRPIGKGFAIGRKVAEKRGKLPATAAPVQPTFGFVPEVEREVAAAKPPPPRGTAAIPPRTTTAAIRKPFTPEERAILKREFGYTDNQISAPGGNLATMRKQLDDFKLLNDDVAFMGAMKERATPGNINDYEKETVSLRELASIVPRSAGILREILDVAAQTRGDVPVHVLSTADFAELTGEIDPEDVGIAYFSPSGGYIATHMEAWAQSNTKEFILAHEGAHAVTVRALSVDPILREGAESVLAELRTKLAGKGFDYELQDVRELFAALANERFTDAIKNYHLSVNTKQALGLPTWKPANFVQALIEIVRRAFGFSTNRTNALQDLLTTYHKIAARPDITTEGRAAIDNRVFLKNINKSLEPASAVTMARNLMNSTAYAGGNIDRTLMKIRTNDSLMRTLEEYYPGVARKFHNLVMNRYVRAQALAAQDVDVQLERQNILRQYKGLEIDGQSIENFYNDLLSDQNNRNIDAAIPLADNKWLGEGNIQREHYPALRKQYEKLLRHAPKMAAYMAKEWKYFKAKQKLLTDTAIRNIVMTFAKDKSITPERALEVGRRIVQGEATVDDLKVMDDATTHRLETTPELRIREGVYAPQLRFGDWVVNARVRVDAPKWKNVFHQTELDGVVYDFYGDDLDAAKAAATRYASHNNEGELREEYSTNPREVWVGPKGELRKEDGTKWASADKDAGARKVYRVHIQDRHTAFFEREGDAKSAVEELKKDKYYAEVKGYTRRLGEPFAPAASVSSRQMAALIDQLDKHNATAGMPPDVRAATVRAIQEAANAIAPGTSISKRRMQRRHVQGASKDAARAMHSYSVQINNYIAAAELAPKISAAERELLDAMRGDYSRRGRGVSIGNELIKRQWAQNGMHENSSPWVNFFTSLVFMDKLVSVAYSVINGIQLYSNTLPRLTAKFGAMQAERALHRAMADIHYGKVLSRGMKDTMTAMAARLEKSTDLIDYIVKSGKVSDQERLMLLEMVNRGSLNADAGFEASAVLQRNAVTKGMGYFDTLGRQMPRAIDAGSRAISLLASYRLARDAGMSHEQAMDVAQDITDETQFNYSPVNSPPAYNTGLGRIALQFTRYPLAMYQYLGAHGMKMIKGPNRAEAAKSLLLTMAAYTLFAGISGGAPWEPIRAVVTALNGLNIIDWDWSMVEAYVQEMSADMIGAGPAEAFMHGLPRLFDVDMSTRITMGQLFLPPPQGDIQDPGGLYNYMASFFLGPTGGFIRDWPAGIEDMRNGRWLDAGSKFIPVKFLSDAAKSVSAYTTGRRTKAGDVITTYNVPEMLIQTLGFTPGSMARAMEFREAVYSQQSYRQKRREELLQGFWETPKAQRVRPAFVRTYRELFRDYNEGLPRKNWITFDKARDYAKDKDRRFSKSTMAVAKDTSTDYLIERARETFGVQ